MTDTQLWAAALGIGIGGLTVGIVLTAAGDALLWAADRVCRGWEVEES